MYLVIVYSLQDQNKTKKLDKGNQTKQHQGKTENNQARSKHIVFVQFGTDLVDLSTKAFFTIYSSEWNC
jgi:hypothetical protein